MKIRLQISPVHLYLVTPSDKSFLLWKWNLWCIIWFSLWKWPFILYDSCYSRGAPAPFHFIVGFSDRRRDRLISILYKGNNPIGKTRVLTFCRESETLGSLWITRDVYSRRHISPNPIIYVDIWIYNFYSTVNPITVHEPLVSLASPRFRALPPTTNTIQNKRYCSH